MHFLDLERSLREKHACLHIYKLYLFGICIHFFFLNYISVFSLSPSFSLKILIKTLRQQRAHIRPTKFSSVDDYWVSLSKLPHPGVIRFEIDRVDEGDEDETSGGDGLANFVTFVGRILLFFFSGAVCTGRSS